MNGSQLHHNRKMCSAILRALSQTSAQPIHTRAISLQTLARDAEAPKIDKVRNGCNRARHVKRRARRERPRQLVAVECRRLGIERRAHGDTTRPSRASPTSPPSAAVSRRQLATLRRRRRRPRRVRFFFRRCPQRRSSSPRSTRFGACARRHAAAAARCRDRRRRVAQLRTPARRSGGTRREAAAAAESAIISHTRTRTHTHTRTHARARGGGDGGGDGGDGGGDRNERRPATSVACTSERARAHTRTNRVSAGVHERGASTSARSRARRAYARASAAGNVGAVDDDAPTADRRPPTPLTSRDRSRRRCCRNRQPPASSPLRAPKFASRARVIIETDQRQNGRHARSRSQLVAGACKCARARTHARHLCARRPSVCVRARTLNAETRANTRKRVDTRHSTHSTHSTHTSSRRRRLSTTRCTLLFCCLRRSRLDVARCGDVSKFGERGARRASGRAWSPYRSPSRRSNARRQLASRESNAISEHANSANSANSSRCVQCVSTITSRRVHVRNCAT